MEDKLFLAAGRFDLTNIETIYEQPYRAVYAAQSDTYGPVILKICDHTQLCDEYTMLKQLNGNGCCKVYAYDEENGFLLEQRLLPGTVLRAEGNLIRRIEVLQNVFYKIHQEVNETDAPVEKNYLDWLEGIYCFCIDNKVEQTVSEKVKQAREICAEMFRKYPERMLLHGDLHHDNILKQADNCYAMIDPKGVIGPEILDLPRFIMNELDTKHSCSDEEHMLEVVSAVSETFPYPILDVAKVYFMEVILGNIWCMEDGDAMNETEIAIAQRILEGVRAGEENK